MKGINESLPQIEEKGEDKNKNLDVFVSYRRSNGSQLARYLLIEYNIWKRSLTYLI